MYLNIFHFTTDYFHLLIYDLNINLHPTLTNSNFFLLTNVCFTPFWYVRIEIWTGCVTCCLTCLGCLINKTCFFWRRLRCTFLCFVSGIFSSSQFLRFCCAMLPQLIFMIVSIKRHFHANITYPDYWTFVAWNIRIFCNALLHHHLKPQFHIFSN